VTVVPLTALQPHDAPECQHRLELKTFRDWPAPHLFGSLPRWARCAHIVTVSLDRCADPSFKPVKGDRLTSRVFATESDVAAVEMGVLRALGIARAGRCEDGGFLGTH
jgi:uncharacterized protein YifN (PemK superfamily)